MIRRPTVIAVALAIAGAGSLVRSADQGWTPDLLLKVKRVGPVIPSPDAARVAFIVAEAQVDGEKSHWLSHVHVAAADGSGAFQLTQGEKSATSPKWSPDGQWIAFLSQRGGDKYNLFRIRVAGGEAEQLTDEKGGIIAFEWSPDGQSIAFSMPDAKTDKQEKADKEKRDARVVDETDKLARLYVIAVAKHTDGKRPLKRLAIGEVHVTDLDWSPDSESIVFAHQKTTKVFQQNDISVIRASGGEPRSVAATNADESSPVYSRDGRSIAFLVTDDPPTWAFTTWVRVAPAAGGPARALAKTFDEQPEVLGWSADGRSLYVWETHGTIGRVSALPADGGAPTVVSGTDVHVGTPTLNRNGTALGFSGAWADKAPEPFVSPLPSFAAKQVANVQSISSAKDAPIARTEALKWKVSDGTEIEGLLTYPLDSDRPRRVPLLVVVHGGPTGVFTQSFIGMPSPYPIAILAARGYAILRVNAARQQRLRT